MAIEKSLIDDQKTVGNYRFDYDNPKNITTIKMTIKNAL